MFDEIEAKINDPQVLEAILKVPRSEFVPEEYWYLVDEDRPLPIGYEQTISQPYIVALMTELLELQSTDRVLEIGTGSGYQTAVLAELAEEIYTIELVAPLAQRGRKTLEMLGYRKIHYRIGDGFDGWPEAAPFNAIILASAAAEVPLPLLQQLSEDGRMVIPIGPAGGVQTLYKYTREGSELKEEKHGLVRFVPFVRGQQKKD